MRNKYFRGHENNPKVFVPTLDYQKMNAVNKHYVYLCHKEIKANIKNKTDGVADVSYSVPHDQMALLNQNLVALTWMISQIDSSKRQKTRGDVPVVPDIAALVRQGRVSDYTGEEG